MSQPDNWLNEFVARVMDATTLLTEPVEIACHTYFNEAADSGGEWEVTVFAEPDTLGGRLDAFPLQPATSVDVAGLMTVFDSLDSCRWQSETVAFDDELGSHLSVEGAYRGHQIWLRVLSRAPESLTRKSVATSTAGDRQ
jgi:hypothetical protein